MNIADGRTAAEKLGVLIFSGIVVILFQFLKKCADDPKLGRSFMESCADRLSTDLSYLVEDYIEAGTDKEADELFLHYIKRYRANPECDVTQCDYADGFRCLIDKDKCPNN